MSCCVPGAEKPDHIFDFRELIAKLKISPSGKGSPSSLILLPQEKE